MHRLTAQPPTTDVEHVTTLAFGRWRSQILYAAAELRIFDHLDRTRGQAAGVVAERARLDPALSYRLMRALAALGLVQESERREFTLTSAGHLMRSDADGSLLYMVLLEEGPEHYALWKHLPAMVRDGHQNAFVREYGKHAFDHAHEHPEYASVFKQAMSSFSGVQSRLALEALRPYDLSGLRSWCDVAGGQGHLLCSILDAYPQLRGTVFDLPAVVAEHDGLWASKLGVEDRCQYVGGDMFADVPAADAYSLKMIMHDWDDDECVAILANLRRRVTGAGRVFIVEHIVPPASEPHFSKLYDIHMMCWGTGRERTEAEYAQLLSAAGWTAVANLYPGSRQMGVVVGKPADAT
jgi:hypothetical protein